MNKSDLRMGDKVQCVLDQRFKGTIASVEATSLMGGVYLYDVHWHSEDVPHDSHGAMFFGWQLKKIEERTDAHMRSFVTRRDN